MDGIDIREKIHNAMEHGSRMAYGKTSLTLTNVEWETIVGALNSVEKAAKEREKELESKNMKYTRSWF